MKNSVVILIARKAAGHYHRLVNIKTGDTLKHHILMILLNASAVGVGISQKKNSRNQAPGALPLLGGNGGDRDAPGQTRKRVFQHHRKTDLFADDTLTLSVETNSGKFHPGGSAKGRWRTRKK
jgi:hypothetical protein